MKKNIYFLILLLVATSMKAVPIYFHEVRKVDADIIVFAEPIYMEWNVVLNDGVDELKKRHAWLATYEKFVRLDLAVYEDWLETVSVPYQKAFGITEETFESAKSNYDPTQGDDIVGRTHSFLYAVYFKINDRELCKVIGVSSDQKYTNLEDAVASDRGFFTHLFEKIDDHWKLQLPKTETWLDDLSVLPSNIESLNKGGHVLKVKNRNKLLFFEANGVRPIDIVIKE